MSRASCRKPWSLLFGRGAKEESDALDVAVAVGALYAEHVGGAAATPEGQLAELRARVPPPRPATAGWTGHWKVDRRENWEAYLAFLKIPVEHYGNAKSAPDFHEYVASPGSFFMDHQIPMQKLHLRFAGFLDDEWSPCPYPRPTPANFDPTTEPPQGGMWKHRWANYPTTIETTIADFGRTGANMVMLRELCGDEIKYVVNMVDPETGAVRVGPCTSYYARTSREPPQLLAAELKAAVAARTEPPALEARLALLEALGRLLAENRAALLAADGAEGEAKAAALKQDLAFYKANLSWMQGEHMPLVLQPKGVALVLSPPEAPVLGCLLPLAGLLAAGDKCVLTPSAAAPVSSRLLARLVPKYFPARDAVVVEGGADVIEELMATPMDLVIGHA